MSTKEPELRWPVDATWIEPHRARLAALPAQVEVIDPADVAALAEALAAVAAVDGPEAALPAARALAPALEAPLRGRGAAEVLDRLSLRSAAECCGAIAPSLERDRDADKALSDVVKSAASLPKRARFTAAFAALALGRTSLVTSALSGVDDVFEPVYGQRSYNITGALRHLAEYFAAGGWPRQLCYASHELILRFPHRLAVGRMGWGDLLWTGRIYFRATCGRPVGEVAKDLHRVIASGVQGAWMDARVPAAEMNLRALLGRVSKPVRAALEDAVLRAMEARHAEATLEHLLAGLLRGGAPELTVLLGELGVDAAAVNRKLDAYLAALPGGHAGKPTFAPRLVFWLHDAAASLDDPAAPIGSGALFALLVRDPTRSEARLDDVMPWVRRTTLSRALAKLDRE